MTTLLTLLYLLACIVGAVILGWLLRARLLGQDEAEPVARSRVRFGDAAHGPRDGD